MLVVLIICIFVGLCTGFLSGFFGIGGGFILVPVLVKLIPYTTQIVDENIMVIATSTSLASILLSSCLAVYMHAKKKNLHFNELLKYSCWVAIGTIFAKFAIHYISDTTLKIIFLCFLYIVVVRYIIKVLQHKKPEPHNKKINPYCRALVGLFTGAFSIFVGVGGGVPTTLLYSNYRSLRFSIGMGAGATIIVSISSIFQSVAYALFINHSPSLENFGGINIPLAVSILPTLIVMIPLGINAMHKIDGKKLSVLYLLFMITLSTLSTMSFFK